MYYRMVEGSEGRFGIAEKSSDFLTPGRWVNPAVGGLGALVLGGYLLTANPAYTGREGVGPGFGRSDETLRASAGAARAQ